jgi:hypothetical protein
LRSIRAGRCRSPARRRRCSNMWVLCIFSASWMKWMTRWVRACRSASASSPFGGLRTCTIDRNCQSGLSGRVRIQKYLRRTLSLFRCGCVGVTRPGRRLAAGFLHLASVPSIRPLLLRRSSFTTGPRTSSYICFSNRTHRSRPYKSKHVRAASS